MVGVVGLSWYLIVNIELFTKSPFVPPAGPKLLQL